MTPHRDARGQTPDVTPASRLDRDAPTLTIAVAGATLPDDLRDLAASAAVEGIRIVATVIDRWVDGTQRYDASGETLLIARSGAQVVAVGGLAWCPNVSGALRVRRFYVDPAWRRGGVARALATQLIDGSAAHTATLTCNAGASAAAPPFWESLGFEAVDVDGITHTRVTSPRLIRRSTEVVE